MLWALLQISDASPLVSLGVGGAIAALVIGFWRQERKESADRYAVLALQSQERYAVLAKEAQERYAILATDFRSIVQDNTRALTVLSEAITSSDSAITVRMLREALATGKLVNVALQEQAKHG